MDGWAEMDEWIDACMGEWMDGWIHRDMDGCMDGWMGAWMDARMDGGRRMGEGSSPPYWLHLLL